MFGGAAFVAGTAVAYIDDPEQLPFDLSNVAQKALQQLDAERAHNVAIWAAVHGLLPIEKRADPPRLRTTVWGKHFSNPIGTHFAASMLPCATCSYLPFPMVDTF